MVLQNSTYTGLFNVFLDAEALKGRAAELGALRTRALRRVEGGLFPKSGLDRRGLHAFYKLVLERTEKGFELPPAAAVLRDEFYVLEKNLLALRAALDELESARLPVCAEGAYTGLPRVYMIAASLVGHREGRLDEASLNAFLCAFQDVSPLSMRELWLLKPMLRIALVKLITLEATRALDAVEQYDRAEESLSFLLKTQSDARRAAALEKLMLPKNPACADYLISRLEEKDAYAALQTLSLCLEREDVEAESLLTLGRRLLTSSRTRMENALRSLRFLEALNWPARYEEFSRVESCLKKQESYARMDAATRAYYRSCVERLARRLNVAETVVARHAVLLSEGQEGKKAEAGYYLFMEGQSALFYAIRPDIRFKERDERTKLAYFFGAVFLMAALLVVLSALAGPLAALLSVLPALSIAYHTAVFLFTRFTPARHIPRFDLKSGVPPECATLVVVPTLVTSEDGVRAGLEQLETHYLANRHESCYFAMLADFKDGPHEEAEGDAALLRLAKKLTQALNQKYSPHSPVFFYLHRKREYCEQDGVYMGRERKRGALMDLTELLLNDARAPFCLITSPLPKGLTYCLTLDADTVLPRETLRVLIGAMAHPLNKPETDRYGIVRAGYGVLAPRMRALASSAARSPFARLVSGDFGLDAYAAAASEFYQDVFGEGVFCGKGIFDIRVFHDALYTWIPDNAVLSHDLLEGCFIRAGFMNDVALYDGEPSTFIAWWKRRHRWLRGDFQLLPFTRRFLSDAAGTKHKSPLTALSRVKMCVNLLKSLVPVAAFLALCFTPFTGFWLYSALALTALLDGLAIDFIVLLGGFFVKKEQAESAGALKELYAPLALVLLFLSTLPFNVYRTLDAVFRTLHRVFVSHRRLLEWQTAEESAAQKPSTLKDYYRRLFLCPLFGAALFLSAFFLSAPLFSLGLGLLFLAAPYAVMRLDAPSKKPALSEDDRAFILEAARATWRFFEEFCVEESGFLPPDNVQHAPRKAPVTNTSPTNIGMGLVSCVSAFDCGFIEKEALIARLSSMLASIEALEKWNGHLYNWYDLHKKSVLTPRYVSTVDSGNLAACLLTAEQALLDLEQAELGARCRRLAEAMDFTALYDAEKELFHIGFDVEAGMLSKSWYDLLASEARLTSLVAIALSQIGLKSWTSLGRLLTYAGGGRALLSWGGTMFEYLMPLLFTGVVDHTLLEESCASAVEAHMRNAEENEPWGVSESGYYAFDRSMYYQYRAFGVPRLALQPERERERVIAPYASALALMVKPHEAASNLMRIKDMGGFDAYGFYEAIDHTQSRVKSGEGFEFIKSHMAHHQGMALCSMNNVLNENALQKRFLSIPEIRAVKLLLEERRPALSITIRAYESGVYGEKNAQDAKKPCVRKVVGSMLVPETQLLTNGHYTVFLCDSGLSYSRCGSVMLTRWRPDALRQDAGVQVLIRDGARAWPVAGIPAVSTPHETTFEPHKVAYARTENGIKATVEVCVLAARDAEARRVTLTNTSTEARELELGLFADVCMETQKRDMAHPGFVKLTVSPSLADDVLLFEKRAAKTEDFSCMYCMLLGPSKPRYQTDRLVSPGRGKNLAEALLQPMLEGVEPSPEPGLSARAAVNLKEGGTAQYTFVIGYAANKKQALFDAAEIRAELEKGFDSALHMAWAHANSALRFAGLTEGKAMLFERMAARLILELPKKPFPASLPREGGVERLWKLSISGDEPIVLMRVKTLAEARMVKTLLEFHDFCRTRGERFDLVLVGEYPHEYANDLRHRLEDMLLALCRDRSSVHLLHGFLLSDEERALLNALATVCVEENKSLDKQFMPESVKRASLKNAPARPPSRGAFVERHAELLFFNGLGGFDAEKNEYVTLLKKGNTTPLPWSHILTNERFGTLLTESGGGYTWHKNSRENKLTNWFNDTLRDPKGEMLLLSDEDDGSTWSITPGRLQSEAECAVRYGFGYAVYESAAEELISRLTVFTDASEPVKYALLTLTNPMMGLRRIRLLYCADWVLGPAPHPAAVYVKGENNLSLARSLRTDSEEYAYIAINGMSCEHSADRLNVLNGGWDAVWPEENGAVKHGGFSALRTILELRPGETKTVVLLMGQTSLEDARATALKATQTYVEERLNEVKRLWEERLFTIRVKTPDAAANLMLNGWLMYQNWSSRILARTGYYQCGGAIGFRDQLQDMLSLLQTHPARVRAHILLAASKQFEAGDVLHWWHDGGSGVRTYISDDKLFLPFVLMEYLKVTGDEDVLSENIPYLADCCIPENARDLHDRIPCGASSGSLHDHCVRAIESALKLGAHGLPLMGGGDWNDGMDLVGQNGGESVWLGFFLLHVLERFAPLCESQGEPERAARYKEAASSLRENLEAHGWDGAWYRRAYFADGTPLGARENEQCAIDCVSQAWAALCGAVHGKEALTAVKDMLLDEESGVLKLLAPPFDKPGKEVGYISAYLPGMRENGGQYTHAATWAALAACKAGDAALADRVFRLLNPILHADSPLTYRRYKAEPYVLAGDVYSVGKNAGRAGWTWYTGAASWMYVVGIEHILGIKRKGNTLVISPCTVWEEYSFTYRFGGSAYDVTVRVTEAGEEEAMLELVDDGRMHTVAVEVARAHARQ